MPIHRLYHDDLYHFDKAQPSYWEATAGPTDLQAAALDADDRCEVVIIGGGYTGLSAAYQLAKEHHIEVRVLEAGHIGWGASGRNGGFCSIGGTSLGLNQQLDKFGLENVRHFYQMQVDAVELVRGIIRDEGIDAQPAGDAELEVAHSPRLFAELKEQAELQYRMLGLDTAVISAERYRCEYFDCAEQFGAVQVKPTFGLHPMRYVLGLACAAEKYGATLHRNSEVVGWEKKGNDHVLRTRHGTLRCRYVIMATNGFMPETLNPAFRGRPLPMISAIVVTRPLDDADLAAQRWQTTTPAITSRKLMNYFRLLPDNRFLFGGRGSAAGDDATAARNYQALINRLGQLFPAWTGIQIDYRWHGLICITKRLTPCVGRLADDPSVLFGFGYHGNGVNTSTWTGRQLADWLASSTRRDATVPKALPVMMRGLSGRFPFPALRRRYVQARIAMFRLSDWLA